MQFKKPLIISLALAGVIPFLLATIHAVSGEVLLGIIAEEQVALYGLVILAFMAGTHWGVCLGTEKHIGVLLISNMITLIGFFGYLNLSNSQLVLTLVGAFIALLFVDLYLKNQDLISAWYLKLRTVITCVVCLLLLGFV